MKHFAVVQHSYSEFLGIIESQLEKRDIGFSYFRVFLNQELPSSALTFDALFLLGGPMSPLEQDKYPWLEQELQTIAAFRKAGRPIVGLGLGALLIAQQEGAELSLEPYHNAYFTTAHATEAGRNDPLAQAVDGRQVMVWAAGTAQLPDAIEPLVVDDEGRWIAFRPNDGSAMALLFRPEMKPGLIEDILMEEDREMPDNIGDLLAQARELWPEMQKTTDLVLVALVQELSLMSEKRKPRVFSLNLAPADKS
ncbi:GMP synthase [Acidithiobacillus sp. CV18-2]|nr:GMP synthase [Acidithiobacillus sp. CV18-3]MBU2758404.1 GMP synthase [Acidithiobacillus sp. BN09-2]MBU2776716.1 GMP synthase [Acidithiobacillus sp. CV18-2]MBU2799009.1 GMP synthase [Acidithiobacillus sp. VAN18-4]